MFCNSFMDGKYRKWDYEDHYYGVGMTALIGHRYSFSRYSGFKVLLIDGLPKLQALA